MSWSTRVGILKLPREISLSDHGTVLHVAAKEGSVERARILVERGADLGKKSRYEYTADQAQLEKKEDVKTYLENVMRQRKMEARELDEEKDDDEENWY